MSWLERYEWCLAVVLRIHRISARKVSVPPPRTGLNEKKSCLIERILYRSLQIGNNQNYLLSTCLTGAVGAAVVDAVADVVADAVADTVADADAVADAVADASLP
jgi:hypothetical protein